MTRSFASALAGLAVFALSWAATGSAQAQTTYVWNKPAGGSWANPSDWNGGVVATGSGTNNNIADFSQLSVASGGATVTLDGNQSIGGLIFGDTSNANGWTINAGAPATSTLTLVSNVGPTINVINQSATINAVLAGTNGFTLTSTGSGAAGTLALTAANTISGSIIISSGTLQIANNLAAQNATVLLNAGSLTFASSITAPQFGNLAGTGSFLLSTLGATPAAVALTVGGNNSSAGFSGSIGDRGLGGSLIKTGSGSFTLSGVSTYSGGTTLQSGTLVINNATSAVGSGPLTLSGGTLQSGGLNTGVVNNTIVVTPNTNTNISDLGGDFVFFGPITGGGAQNGSLTIVPGISDSVWFYGDPSAFTGVINYSNVSGLANLRLDNVLGGGTNFANAIFNLTGTINSTRDISLNGVAGATVQMGALQGTGLIGGEAGNNDGIGFTLQIGNLGLTTTFSGLITKNLQSGQIALNIVGGSLTLTGANTFTGPTTITAGTLIVSNQSALQNSTVTPPAAPAVLAFDSSIGSATFGGLSGSNNFALVNQGGGGVNLTVGANTSTYSGIMSDGGNNASLTKTGAGTLVLANDNTYTGGTTITGGRINLGVLQTPTSGPLGAGGVYTNGGAIQYTIPNQAQDFSSMAGFFNSSSIYGVDTNNLTITWAGILTGQGLTKLGPGTLILTGHNTFNGTTTVGGGVLNLGVAENAGTSGPLGSGGSIVFSGGTLQYSAANQFDYSSRISAFPNQPISVDPNGQTVTWANGLTSSGGSLTVTGSNGGTLILTGSSSGTGFTGTTMIAGNPTLQIGDGGNALANSTVFPTTALTFSSGTIAAAFGSLAGTGNLVLSTLGGSPAGVNLTINGNGNSSLPIDFNVYSGNISGGVLTMSGGVLSLAGANTYTGPTNINGGLLIAGGAETGTASTIGTGPFGAQKLSTAETIFFGGGALGYVSSANTADYSGRFSQAVASQQYAASVAPGLSVTWATPLNSSGGSLTLSGGLSMPAAANDQYGGGTLTLTGTGSSFNGGTTIGAGTLAVGNGTAGSLTGGGALTFTGTGALTLKEPNATSTTFSSLTLTGGDATITSTYGTSGSTLVTLTSLSRSAGTTANFVVSGGTATTNQIVITGQAAGDLGPEYFFGGTNFAYYDSTGYVRGINYGTDKTNGSTGVTSVSITTTAATIGSVAGADVKTTVAITAQTSIAINTLNIGGAVTMTMASAAVFQTNAILAEAGAATLTSVASPATIPIVESATAAGELIIRTNASTDSLTITTDIIANHTSASSVVKSGLGTLTTNVANTFSGPLTINGGIFSTSSLAAPTTPGGTTGAQGIGESGTLNLNGGAFQYTGGNSILAGGVGWSPNVNVGPAGGTVNLSGGLIFSSSTFIGTGTLTVINSAGTNAAWWDLGYLYGNGGGSPNFSGNLVIGGATPQFATITGNQSGIQWRGGFTNQTLGTGSVIINSGGLLMVEGIAGSVTNNLILNGGVFGSLTVAGTYTGSVYLQSNSYVGDAPTSAGLITQVATSANWNANNLASTVTTVTGVISGPSTASLTKVSQQTVNFTGVNTYQGATIVAGGQLNLVSGALASNSVSVVNSAANATLGIGSNYTIGTGTATLTVGASGQTGLGSLTFLTSETSTSTLNVNHTAPTTTAITLGVSSSVPAILNLNTGNYSTDEITTGGNIVVNGAVINFTALYGGALSATQSPYPLITTTGSGSTATFSNVSLGSASTFGESYFLTSNATTLFLNVVASLPGSSTAYWTGSVDANWNTTSPTSNWVTTPAGGTDAGLPGTSTDVIFTANSFNASNLSTTLGQAFSINSLTFNGTTSAPISIAGTAMTPLTIGASSGSGITVASGSGAISISAPIVIGNSQSWSSASANGLTVSGGVSGAGTLTLQANSTGGITLSTGAVSFVGGVVNSGIGMGGVSISSALGTSISSVAQNSASSQLTLSGANTYSGPTNLNIGQLNLDSNGALGTGTLVIANGTTIDNTLTGSTLVTLSNAGGENWSGNFTFVGTSPLNTGTGPITLEQSLTVTVLSPTNALTVAGVIAGPTLGKVLPGLTKAGPGTLVANAANTFTGPLTITGGIFSTSILGTTGAQGMGQSLSLILNGGTFQYTGGNFVTSSYWQPIITVGSAGGTINLTNGIIFSNAVFAGSGTLTVINSTNTGGWLDQGGSGTTFSLPSPKFSGNIIIGGNGTQPAIAVTGAQSGMQWRGGPVYLPLGTGTITVQGGTNGGGNLMIEGYNAEIPNNINLNGGVIGSLSVNGLYTGNVTLQSTSYIGDAPTSTGNITQAANSANWQPTNGNTVTTTVSGVIGGASGFNLTKVSLQNLVLLGANTYQGQTIISGGVLQVGNGGAAGTLGAGAVSLTAPASVASTLAFDLAGTYTVANNIGSSGAGTNTVSQIGLGNTILTGTNTYTGPTVVTLGTLTVASNLASQTVTVANSSTLASLLASGNVSIGTVAAPATVTVGPSTGLGILGFSTAETAPSTLTVVNAAGTTAITLGSAAATAALSFNTSGTTADEIVTAGKLVLNAGGALVNLVPTFGTLTSGPVTLMSYGSSTLTGSFLLGANAAPSNFAYTLSTTSTALSVNVVPTTLPTSASAYWTGSQNSVWNTNLTTAGPSNWTTTAGGGTDSGPPGVITNVFFSAGSLAVSSTLGQGFTINSLNFTSGGGPLTIGGAVPYPLQINATTAGGNTAGNGISLAFVAPAVTINAPIILGGSQTWTNSSLSTLTASSVVTGTANLTLTTVSAGAIAASGTIANTGTLTLTSTWGPISVGTVNPTISSITFTGSAASSSTVTNLNVGTINANSSGLVSIGTIGNTGALTINDSGTGPTAITTAIATTVTGNVTINSGASAGFITINGNVNNYGTLTIAGTGANIVTFTGIIGASTGFSTSPNPTSNVSGVIVNGGPNSVVVSNVANNFYGPLQVNSGVFSTSSIVSGSLTSSGQWSPNPAGAGTSTNIILNGGTFQYSGGNFTSTWAPTITVGPAGGTFDLGGTGLIFSDASFVGTGTLTVTNSLNHNSAWLDQQVASPNFSGNIVIGNGVGSQAGIQWRSGNAGNVLGTGTITINTGGLLMIEAAAGTIPNNLNLNGGLVGSLTVNGLYTGNVTLQSTSYMGDAPNATGFITQSPTTSTSWNTTNTSAIVSTFSGNISGGAGASLVKVSQQTVVLTANNGYSGGTMINGGVLQVGNGGTTGSLGTGPVTNNFSLVFDLSGASTMVNNIANAGTITANGTGTVTFSGVISGAGSFTQTGGGASIFTGANTYTGATNVPNGTLQLGTQSGSTVGSLSSSTSVTLGAGTTSGALILGDGGNPVNQSLTSLTAAGALNNDAVVGGNAGNSTLTLTNSGTVTFAGSLGTGNSNQNGPNANNLALTMAGTGTLSLTGSNTYTGPTVIQSGTLQIGPNGSLPFATPVTIGGGATSGILDLDGNSPAIGSLATSGIGMANIIGNSSTSGATLNVNSPGTSTFGGTIQNTLGAGNQNVALSVNSGTLILTGVNTYTGATNIGGGTLQLGNGTVGGSIIGPVNNISGNLAFNLPSSSIFAPSASATNGGGMITQMGPGTLTIPSPAPNFSGTAIAAGGTLRLTSTSLGSNASVAVNDGASLSVYGGGGSASSLTLSNLTLGSTTGSTLIFEMAGTNPTNPIVTVTNSLTVNGTITVNITNDATLTNGSFALISYANYTGPTIVSAFNLVGQPNARTTATLTFPAGAVDLMITSSDSTTWTGSVSNTWDTSATTNWKLNSNGSPTNFMQNDAVTFTSAGAGAISIGAAVNPASVTFNLTGGASYTFNTSGGFGIGGTGALTIGGDGSGSVTLNTANTYSGGTVLNAGHLNINNNSAIGSGPLTIANGTTIDNTNTGNSITLTTNNIVFINGNFTFGGSNPLNLGTGSVLLGNNVTVALGSSTLTINGSINDAGNNFSLTVGGTGALSLGGNNGLGGGVTINSGQLNINSASALGSGALNVNGGTISNTSGAPVTVTVGNAINLNANFTFGGNNALNLGNGNVTIVGGGVTITANGSAANALTLGGALSGGNLTIGGPGAVSLSGASNGYGGTITVNGQLNINGGAALGTTGLVLNPGSKIDNTSGAPVTVSTAVPLAVNGNFTFNGTSALNTGTGAVTMAGTTTVTLNGPGVLTVGGVISGTGAGLTVAGTGTMIANQANTFSGPLVINGGVFQTSSGATAIGTAQGMGTSGLLTLNGGTFRSTFTNGSSAGPNFSPTITVGANGGTWDYDAAGPLFFGTTTGGSWTGSGTLTIANSNPSNQTGFLLVEGNSPSFTGAFIIGGASTTGVAGVQYRSNQGNPFGANSVIVTVQANGILTADTGATSPGTLPNNITSNGGVIGAQAGSVTYGGSITLSGVTTTTFASPANGAVTGTITVTGAISGGGNLLDAGSINSNGGLDTNTTGESLVLVNTNTYLGTTQIGSVNSNNAPIACTLTLGNGTTAGTLGAGAVTILTSSVLKFNEPAGTYILANSITGVAAGGVSGTTALNPLSGGITVAGAAGVTVNLTGPVNIFGPVIVTTGALNTATLGNPTTITIAGGATAASLQLSSSMAVGYSVPGNTLYSTGTLTIGSSTGVGTFAFANSESSLSTLTINAQAVNTSITLGSANAFTAVLDLNTGNSGTDQINTLGKLSVGAGKVTVNLTPLPSTTLAPGGYTLLNYGVSTVPTGLFVLGTYPSGTGDAYFLTSTATSEVLNVVAIATGNAYWTGSQSAIWNTNIGGGTTNFVVSGAGGGDSGVPTSTSNVFMTANSAANLTNTLGQSFTINSLNFTGTGTSATAGVSVGGTAATTLTINALGINGNAAGSGITVAAGSGADTVSAPIILGGNQSWSSSSSNLLTISGGVIGTANLTLQADATGGITISTTSINNTGTITNAGSGAGPVLISALIGSNVTGVTQNAPNSTMTLSNAGNLYTGSTTIQSGKLSVSADGDLGAPATGLVFTGGTLAATATFSSARTVSLTGNGTIDVASGAVLTMNGLFSGPGSLTLVDTGTLVLTNASNSYGGGTTIQSGTLNINSDGALGAATGTVTLNGGSLQFVAGGGVTLNPSRNVVLGGTGVIDTNGADDTIQGVISGSGNLTVIGGGALTVTAANTYTGSTVVNAGELIVSSTGSLGAGPLVVGNPNTSMPPTQNGLFLFNSAQTVGPLSGTIAQPANGNTANIFLSAATTLTINQTAAGTFQGDVYGGGSLVLGASSNNTLQLSGNSTYTGSTTINGGTVQLNVSNALPASTALSFAAGVGSGTAATLNLNNNNQQVGSLSGGSPTSGFIQTGSGVGGVLTVVNPGSSPTTFGGVISGNGGLVLGLNNTDGPNNTAMLILTGPNSFTGPVTINSGTLQAGANWVLNGGVALPIQPPFGPLPTPYPGTFTLAASANATFDLNNFNVAIGSLQGGGPAGGNITLGNGNGSPGSGGTLQIIQSQVTIYAGVISGNGNLIVGSSAGGQLILAGHNTYNGSTYSDVIVIATNNALPTNNNVIFGSGSTDGLDLNGFNQQVSTILGGAATNDGGIGTIVDSASGHSVLTLAYAASNPPPSGSPTAFTGVIANDVNVVIDAAIVGGTQTVEFSGPNNTTGALTVGARSNSTSSGVANSLTIDTAASVFSALTIGNGFASNLRNSVTVASSGSLTVGSVTIGDSAAGGTGSNALNVNGPVTVSGAITIGNTISGSTSANSVVVGSGGTLNAGSLVMGGSANPYGVNTVSIASGGALLLSSPTIVGDDAHQKGSGSMIVNGSLGNATAPIAIGGLTIEAGGVLGGSGTVTTSNTGAPIVISQGLVRGGADGTGNNPLGTLTITPASVANAAKANPVTVTGTGTPGLNQTGGILTEVQRTGAGTASASLISILGTNKGLNLNTGGTGGFSAINLVLSDPTGSMVPGEAYTINVAQVFTVGAIRVMNTNQPAGTVIDFSNTAAAQASGTPVVGPSSGQNTNVDLYITGNNNYSNSVASWSLAVDPTGNILQLSLVSSAVPEPEHLLLVCTGALLAGLAIRRRCSRLRARGAASVV